MATILDFRPGSNQRADGQRQGSETGGMPLASAELIFFPGVRYERFESIEADQPDEAAPRKRMRKGRGRSHDQIELPD